MKAKSIIHEIFELFKKKTVYSRLQLDDYISHLDSEVFYLLAKCMIL